MDINEKLIELISTIFAGIAGGIFTYLAMNSSLKTQSIQMIYENVFYPIFLIIEPYANKQKTEKDIDKIRKVIIKQIRKSNGAYTKRLYYLTEKLSLENFDDYYKFIQSNCNLCRKKLKYFTPYNFYGKEAVRGKRMFWGALILVSILYFLIIVFSKTVWLTLPIAFIMFGCICVLIKYININY